MDEVVHYYLGPPEVIDRPENGFLYRASPGEDAVGRLIHRARANFAGSEIHIYKGPRVHPDFVLLGTDLDATVRAVDRIELHRRLELTSPLLSTRLDDILEELFTVHAKDLTGAQTWRPPSVNRAGEYLFMIPGVGVIKREKVTPSHHAFLSTVAVFKVDYIRNRASVDRGDMPLRALQGYTGAVLRKLGMTLSEADQILPAQFLSDGARRPGTIFADTFVEGSDTTLTSHTATGPNGGHGYIELGTAAQTVIAATDILRRAGSAETFILLDTNMGDADHDVSMQHIAVTRVGAHSVGVIGRKNADADVDDYFLADNFDTSGAETWRLFENTTAGGFNSLGTSTAVSLDANDILHLDIDGNVQLLIVEGHGTLITGGSTELSGNLRVGIRGDSNDVDNSWDWDNFSVDDEVAAGGGIRNPFGGPMVLRNPLGA